MRKLRGNPTDSLDLLLDTLCNVFGGIILIACLLALLTRDQKGETKKIVNESHGQLLERRIEAATEEIEGLKQLLMELDRAGHPGLRKLAAERDSLKQTLERLRGDKAEAKKQQAKATTDSFVDPGRELTALRIQVQKKQLELEASKSQLSAVADKLSHLTDRIAQLQGELRTSEANRIVKLRFPKERAKTKGAFPVILRHGQIYPLSVDFPGLARRFLDEDSIEVTPLPGQGLTLPNHAADVHAIIATCMKTDRYVTIYVFPDSFESFRKLKSLMHDANCEYGIEVWEDHEPLRFGSRGTSPNPL
jgi:hypothetical protein